MYGEELLWRARAHIDDTEGTRRRWLARHESRAVVRRRLFGLFSERAEVRGGAGETGIARRCEHYGHGRHRQGADGLLKRGRPQYLITGYGQEDRAIVGGLGAHRLPLFQCDSRQYRCATSRGDVSILSLFHTRRCSMRETVTAQAHIRNPAVTANRNHTKETTDKRPNETQIERRH